MTIVDQTKAYFLEQLEPVKETYHWLPVHIPLVVKSAEDILPMFPKANKDVVVCAAWLHDLGEALHGLEPDHAVTGEEEARKFLSTITDDTAFTEQVAHCVRAHRNKDVPPATDEAKIVAAADSVAHLIDSIYIQMIHEGKGNAVIAKLERDYRDISLIPTVQAKYHPLYEAWKQLLTVFPKDMQIRPSPEDVRLVS